jgi:CheY-like chemotaxis protein/HPt (histidine-containing phosphotransfer) domain-containing protein
MVGLMGGELRVESAPGKGSDFWFSLPLRLPSETAEVAPGIAAASQSVDAQAIDGLRILVVDDDSINRSVAVHFLLELGASADEAESGHAAIAALSKTRYDAVLMDCSMPGMDGYETTTRIRGGASLDPGTPIVAVTAYTQEEDRERCFASGMDEYLAKPISIDTLRSAVACAIAKRASGQTSAAASPLGTGRSDSEADRVGTEDFLSRYDDDRELGRKILTMFLEMAGPLFEEAKEALGRRDRSRIKAIAHRFKGSAGAVGASELVTLADGIMRLCSPDSGAGDEAVEEAMGLFEEALDRFLKRIPLIIEGWA